MNIREFAEKCNLSPGSVSRIMNRSRKDAHASQETYDFVRKKARELGYQPNYAAKTLHTRRSYSIGLIMGHSDAIFLISMINGVTRVCYDRGIATSIVSCNADSEFQENAFESMLYRGVDGILWYPYYESMAQLERINSILKHPEKNTPVVTLCKYPFPMYSRVHCDGRRAAEDAALLHLAKGCRHFAVIRPGRNYLSLNDCNSDYRRTLLAHGVPAENITELELFDDLSADSLKQQMARVDAIWMYYLFFIPAFLQKMANACDLSKIHLAGLGMNEDFEVSEFGRDPLINEGSFLDHFASCRSYIFSGRDVSAAAAKLLIELIESERPLPPKHRLLSYQVRDTPGKIESTGITRITPQL